jgi:hypothetical protein
LQHQVSTYCTVVLYIPLLSHILINPLIQLTPIENINKVLMTVSETIESQMPLILQAIHLYLRNASTEKILFTPIQVSTHVRYIITCVTYSTVLYLL